MGWRLLSVPLSLGQLTQSRGTVPRDTATCQVQCATPRSDAQESPVGILLAPGVAVNSGR